MNILKEELKELIDRVEDIQVLEEVRTLLAAKHPDPQIKEWMTLRALKAEEDIKAGKVSSLEEVRKEIEEYRKK